MPDAVAMIAAAERTGAWPTKLRFEALTSASGLLCPDRGVVGTYADGSEKCLASVGARLHVTEPTWWRGLVEAACEAGANPTGCFSLREGTRVLATFEVGDSNGIRTNLVLADSFDGSLRLMGGFTSIKVVCANTLASAMNADGAGWAKLRHTASLKDRVSILEENIGKAIEAGQSVRDAYHAAEAMQLTNGQAAAVFDQLFPRAPEDAERAVRTRADNVRTDAVTAMQNPVNNSGPTLATLWNAATFLVDRKANGETRDTRGGEMLDSLLFGARGQRIAKIQDIVQVVMRDGTVQEMPVDQAVNGLPTVGKQLFAELLSK